MSKKVLLLSVLMSSGAAVGVTPEQEQYGRALYQRIAGAPLVRNAASWNEFMGLIEQGAYEAAAAIGTRDSNFLHITVRNWSSAIVAKDDVPVGELNDMEALLMGVVRDGADARELLTGDYEYVSNASTLPAPTLLDNEHYRTLERTVPNFATQLVRRPIANPQRELAGILSTRQWGALHYNAGTNRRALVMAFQEFLCTPIEVWKDLGLNDYHVRRDVDRAPAGDAATYQSVCRTCHAAMDGMAGAFAYYDFVDQQLIYSGDEIVMSKINRNSHVYPEGYVTFDDGWVNMATENHNEQFGWNGPLQGRGVNALGAMMANSDRFATCMVERVFKSMCRSDSGDTDTLAHRFKSDGYNLKNLFTAVAVHPACLPHPVQP